MIDTRPLARIKAQMQKVLLKPSQRQQLQKIGQASLQQNSTTNSKAQEAKESLWGRYRQGGNRHASIWPSISKHSKDDVGASSSAARIERKQGSAEIVKASPWDEPGDGVIDSWLVAKTSSTSPSALREANESIREANTAQGSNTCNITYSTNTPPHGHLIFLARHSLLRSPDDAAGRTGMARKTDSLGPR